MSAKKGFTILVVDDSQPFRTEIIRTLSDRGISNNFLESANGAEALQTLLLKKVDLVISDWVMPVMDGIKLLQAIRAHPELLDIPVILMTSKGKHDEKVLGLTQGATDYLSKPFNPDEMTVRVTNLLKIREFQETLKLKNQELERLSTTDSLTGVYNRNYLNSTLENEWLRSSRQEITLGCLIIDVDYFKEINDTYGHKTGDLVLKKVADLISGLLRRIDFLCRYGGDEFVIILAKSTKDGLLTVGEKIRKAVENHTYVKGKDLKVSVSIGGISILGNTLKKPEDIISLADEALYEAKKKGRNRVVIS